MGSSGALFAFEGYTANTDEGTAMKPLAIFLSMAVLAVATTADAKGCIKGAVVGGVAGHLAHHHAVLGAVAGCAIGHHYAHKHEAERQRGAAAAQRR